MKSPQSPRFIDAAILSLFTFLITLHPFYLYGELNCYELGIYLPGIDAILDGRIPYRDFFHLRGPLELYIPAFFMRVWGENVAILASYFYLGTVVTLIFGILIAKELYKTRLVLYLMVPVFIARTFPRVTFTFWGGMRYGFGLLAVLFAVYFLRSQRWRWLILSGMAVALAGLTSIEVGFCAFICVPAALFLARMVQSYDWPFLRRAGSGYILGIGIVLVPYCMYLLATHSLGAYLEATWVVVTQMTKVFPDRLLEHYPGRFTEILTAMIPWKPHFKLLTPAYCYIFLAIYLGIKAKRYNWGWRDSAIACVAVYGLLMYMTTFRKLMASQFEMALQPEKILLFFMLEEAFLWLRDRRHKIRNSLRDRMLNSAWDLNRAKVWGINFLILGFVMSSVTYALARYDHRFFAFRYLKYTMLGKDVKEMFPLSGQETERMRLERMRGMVVPSWQAEDFKQLTEFIGEHTQPGERVFMFPELGTFSFVVDRPFVGRFPMATFSWMSDWHTELMRDLQNTRPRFVVIAKDPGPTFENAHFKIASNKRHYDGVMQYIRDHYVDVASTPSLLIRKRK